MRPAKATVGMLKGLEDTADTLKGPGGGTWAPASLSEPLKGDGNLDKVEPMGLKIQSWTLQGRPQVSKTIEKTQKVLNGLKVETDII